METSYVSAQAFSGADLLHGPLAMIDADVPVIAVARPGGAGRRCNRCGAPRASGADVLQVGATDGIAGLGAGVAEELLPILEICRCSNSPGGWRSIAAPTRTGRGG